MKVYMFHYVKPFSKYYHFNYFAFEKKIKELIKEYNIISLSEVNEKGNDDKSILLTFDDGTIDHYLYVYPILKKYNVSGLFFIPSCIETKEMLDIQIIHKLLEKRDINYLFLKLLRKLDKYAININDYVADKTLDDKKMALFKQLLQFKLDKDIRKKIIKEFVKEEDIDTNVESNYMSIKNMLEMKKDNMFFGIHTKTHPRLGLLSKKEQKEEINSNKKFLLKKKIMDKELMTIAFPYGSYNTETLSIMKKENIRYGFMVNDEEVKNNMLIGRLDCNELRRNYE